MTLPVKTFKMFVPDLIASRDGDGRLRIEGVGSSTIRDHHGDSFSLKALRKMAAASQGMVVFMNHSYDIPKDVFGKIEKVLLQKTGEMDPRTKQEIWDLRLGIVVASSNPDAVRNFELIEKDKINIGISVGAMLPEGGYAVDKEAGGRLLIDDVDPVEFSMVGIPASPRAYVDYAVKSIVGVFPDSKVWAKAWDSFLAKSDVDSDDGTTVEDEDGNPILDTAAAATTSDDEEAPRDLDPSEITAGVESEEVVEGPGRHITTEELEEAAHRALGEPLTKDAHPDIEKGKKTHQHPHAHSHEHDHEHGYGDSKTVHKHDHAHQHSHEHAADHEHEDDQNNYEHNHPHNGSWSDEDHAHGDGAVKSEKDLAEPEQPLVRKTKVTVWEDGESGSKTVEVNTGRSKPKADDEDQSVQASLTPDTTGGLGEAAGDGEEDPDILAAEAMVEKSNDNAAALLKSVLGQLHAAKANALQMTTERDVAIDVARKAMNGTREILRRVGELPAGRKTTDFVEIKEAFDDLSDIYDADVRKIMTKKRS